MTNSTILIKGVTNRIRLKHRGTKGETYDTLINRLLNEEKNSANYRNGSLKLRS